ncbi:hypothetical protein FFA01_24610 [Frigoribacterium faeni]|uniref:Uncharacterized protein n=1 Tax=Frigoribacterium faeni TaxID=145483 RepID=A0ABQ0URP3_9MICO|nr:hypothetical protein GCM10025699_75130 [Microbacterium flavescens]GEK84152.1 hypothetical protein FFA01_24610 [Frigoribacterium faeni]
MRVGRGRASSDPGSRGVERLGEGAAAVWENDRVTTAPDEPQQPAAPRDGGDEGDAPRADHATGATTAAAAEPTQPVEQTEPVDQTEPVGQTEPVEQTQPAEPVEIATHDEVTVRRAPKYPVFLIMGALAGVVVSLIVTSLFPFAEGEGVASTYGYFSLWGLTFGGAIGSLVAIVADRVSLRRAKRVTAERNRVDAPEEPPVEGDIEP